MTYRTNAIRSIAGVLGALMLFAAAGAAQTRVDESVDHALSGAVEVVDPVANLLTVRGEDGDLTTVVVTDETTVLKAARPIPLADLAKGDRVTVDWNDRTGRNLATYIEVVDVPAP